MRSSPSKMSVSTEEEDKNGDGGSLLKGGELYVQKGAKSGSNRTLSGASKTEILSSSAQDWKRVYATLTKDSRLVLFDYDKDISGKSSISKKPLLTKVSVSVDISSLEPHTILATDATVSGRRHTFSLTTKERTYYLSASTAFERDEWLLLCNRLLNDKGDSQQL